MKAKPVIQTRHVIYGPEKGTKNREVTRKIRRGVHFIVTKLRQFSFLTNEEINTITIEAELKRRFEEEKDMEYNDKSVQGLPR